MKIEAENIWKDLEQDSSDKTQGHLTRRILPEVNYDIYLAIEKPLNTRALLLCVSSKLLDRKNSYPSSGSFALNRIVVQDDAKDYVTLQLILTNPRHKDIFTILVQNIVDSLALVSEERAAVSELITRLKRWQKFLEKNSPEGLSDLAQRGLYGELWFLREVVFSTFEPVKGILCWTGPKSTPQDFQFLRCAVEVKTTIGKQHQLLSISSERQLDDTAIGTIVLLHLSLELFQGQGETLPEMVASLRSIVSSDALAKYELENLLFEAGYLDIQANRYENTGYIVREHNYFKVGKDFPRIIESELRNGIGDVRYTISVAECKHFAIPVSELMALIG
jgi:Putative  PD-(D/E)XK family member, (DUF4420)